MSLDYAVFSDIHGNHSALQACLDYAVGRGITNFVLLGDYVTDCPNPQKTMELIYVLKQYFNTYIIRGNREDYLLNYRKDGTGRWKKGSASGSLLYTYQNLTDEDFNFFDSLPGTVSFRRRESRDLSIAMDRPRTSVSFFTGKREIPRGYCLT